MPRSSKQPMSKAHTFNVATNKTVILNKFLLAIDIFLIALIVLTQLTNLTEAISATLSIVLSVVGVLFPGLRNFYNQPWFKNQYVTAILAAVFGCIIAFIVTYFINQTRTTSEDNRLMIQNGFEESTNTWEEVRLQQLDGDNRVAKDSSEDTSFPGSIRSELTRDYALTGLQSLRVSMATNEEGVYKGFVTQEVTMRAHSITVFVMTPRLENTNIYYIQLCVPSLEWHCSGGTKLIPGEWTPLTIDLSQDDRDGNAFYNRTFNEITVQWLFDTNQAADFSLFFDESTFLISDP
jgi:phosphate/sulfate permease